MLDERWVSWKMQTSKTWADIEDVLEYTKIDFIDHDHRILVEYALQLNILIHKSDKEFTLELLDEIGTMLTQLYEYAVEHFNREEEFMKKYNLPSTDIHLKEHIRILRMLKNALDDFKLGKVNISHELKMQIMEWLINHINKTDYEFFDLGNWSGNLVKASDWNEVSQIVSLTGINEIDHQHKKLTEHAINIMMSINEETTSHELETSFKSFKDYVVYHFEYEHLLMEKYEIKDLNYHLKQHQYFIERIDSFPSEIMEDISKVDELKVWILTWWINHINETDFNTFKYDNWALQVIENSEQIDEVKDLLRLTGIDTIDKDHLAVMEEIFAMNKLILEHVLNNSLKSEQTKQQVMDKFKKIHSMAEKHFHREEVIMAKYKFKDIKSHMLEHIAILDKINEMLTNFEQDRLYASQNIKTMLLDWWIHHTNNSDYRTLVMNIRKELFEQIRSEEKYE